MLLSRSPEIVPALGRLIPQRQRGELARDERPRRDVFAGEPAIIYWYGALRPVLRTAEDPRDFNRMFRDLIDGDVRQGRKHQLPPSGQAAAGPPKMGKILQTGASVIDGSGNSSGCFRLSRSMRSQMRSPNLPQRAAISGFPSRPQKPLKALADLF